jgi:ankyrin repeat protein
MENFNVVAPSEDVALVTAAFEGEYNLLISLINKGVNVDQQDEYGSTALQWAANHGNPKMVELLLSHGADVSIKDVEGKTALYLAIDNGHMDVINLLSQVLALKRL